MYGDKDRHWQIQKVITGADGAYKFGLPPGNYRVKFKAPGFKTFEGPSVTVSETKMAVLDEKLDVGEQITANPTSVQQEIYRTRRPAVLQPLRFRISVSFPSRSRETPANRLARQTDAHAEDPSADGFDHDVPLIVTVVTSLNAGGKHKHSIPRSAYGSRRPDGRSLFHYRLLCDPSTQVLEPKLAVRSVFTR